MSASASWSYTARATHWPRVGRDGWSSQDAFAAPILFDCDYSAKSERLTDAKGQEFVSRLTIFTERPDIKPGDRVLLGEHAGSDPIVLGALEVRAVGRDADTFSRDADDFRVVC